MSKSIYNCDNCGAEIIFNGDITFKECSYCGNLIALLDNSFLDKGIKEVIPFDITAEEAYYMHGAKIWCDYQSVKNCDKVYIPFYLCKFNFSYLASCLKVTGSGDDKKSEYFDLFIDGVEDSYFACAIDLVGKNPLLGDKEIHKDNIINVELLKPDNYVFMNDKLVNSEKFIDRAANYLGEYYATKGFDKSITILSSDCAEYNKDIGLVLVPFYRLTSRSGKEYHYVLGQRKQTVKQTVKFSNTSFEVLALIGFIIILFALSSWLIDILFVNPFICLIGLYFFIIIFAFFIKKANDNVKVDSKKVKIKRIR